MNDGEPHESSQPYSDAELRLILDESDRLSHRMAGPGRPLYPVGHLVRFYLHFGIHPSVLARRGGQDLRIERQLLGGGREEWYLRWSRPKTGRGVTFPVPDGDREWLPGFLGLAHPTTVRQFERILKKVERAVLYRGYKIGVNPRRFRHTAAVRLVERGIPLTDVQNLLGVSPSTLAIYASRRREDLAGALRQKGWGD